ncbi:MAG: hypothetical protein K0R33_1108 [Mycobacterium sp.]|nr:hypothetical protein [Mycobacterium sp.]
MIRAAVCLIVLLLVGGCTGLPSSNSAAPIVTPMVDVSGEAWSSRGFVVHRQTLGPLKDPDSVIGDAWRAVYLSVSGVDGSTRQVSGAFFTPRTAPPDGGWPVISFGHGTTGIDTGCGPSLDPDLMGHLELVRSFLEDGYAVAATDYEGLGHPGSHPYLEPRTAAFNMIDAVRALRTLAPGASGRWVAYGASQGGQAAWAADELNSYYGSGTALLGSVALSPPVNVTGMAELAWTGKMTERQSAMYPLLVVGLQRYAGNIAEWSYLHGPAAINQAAMEHCQAPVIEPGRAAADLRPDTDSDTEALRSALRRIALPQRALDKPMLVANGDDDDVVLAEWVASAVAESCALGGRIEHLQVPDAGHDGMPEADGAIHGWIADRFAGRQAGSDC